MFRFHTFGTSFVLTNNEEYYLLYKPFIMKVVGIILIIAGILMLVFRGFSFTEEKKVVDVGPLEINKKEKKSSLL